MQNSWLTKAHWLIAFTLVLSACAPITIQVAPATSQAQEIDAAQTATVNSPEEFAATGEPGQPIPPEEAPTPSPETPEAPAIGMANPASGYCQESGGKTKLFSFMDGSQAGLCWFTDGSVCEEWAYFRQECQPGGQWAPLSESDCNAVAKAVESAFGLPVAQSLQRWQSDRPNMDTGVGCQVETTGTGRQLMIVEKGPQGEQMNQRLMEQMLALGFKTESPNSNRMADDKWSFTRRSDICLLWIQQAGQGQGPQELFTAFLNCIQPAK